MLGATLSRTAAGAANNPPGAARRNSPTAARDRRATRLRLSRREPRREPAVRRRRCGARPHHSAQRRGCWLIGRASPVNPHFPSRVKQQWHDRAMTGRNTNCYSRICALSERQAARLVSAVSPPLPLPSSEPARGRRPTRSLWNRPRPLRGLEKITGGLVTAASGSPISRSHRYALTARPGMLWRQARVGLAADYGVRLTDFGESVPALLTTWYLARGLLLPHLTELEGINTGQEPLEPPPSLSRSYPVPISYLPSQLETNEAQARAQDKPRHLKTTTNPRPRKTHDPSKPPVVPFPPWPRLATASNSKNTWDSTLAPRQQGMWGSIPPSRIVHAPRRRLVWPNTKHQAPNGRPSLGLELSLEASESRSPADRPTRPSAV